MAGHRHERCKQPWKLFALLWWRHRLWICDCGKAWRFIHAVGGRYKYEETWHWTVFDFPTPKMQHEHYGYASVGVVNNLSAKVQLLHDTTPGKKKRDAMYQGT